MSIVEASAEIRSAILVTEAETRDAAQWLTAVLAKHLMPADRALVQAGDRGVVSMRSGVPDHPAARAVATLAIANNAASLALSLTGKSGEERATSMLVAGREAVAAAHQCDGVIEQVPTALAKFAHAMGLVAHLAAAAVASSGAEEVVVRGRQAGRAFYFPQSWRTLVDGLGDALAAPTAAPDRESHVAAVAAHGGAVHLMRTFDQFQRHDAAATAVERFARLTVLAAAYAGWAALLPLMRTPGSADTGRV